MSTPESDPAGPIVLFDGVCNLCDAAVTFIIDRDADAVFRFASLQSEVGQRLTQRFGIENEDTVVLVEDGRCYVRSTAALRIARRLDGAWPLLAALLAMPRPLRDAAYRFIARHRYRWFGTHDACRVPTPALRSRFLEYDLP
ncbi:MAG: thiol-disulfide oxidoreductase DCC family protein [Rhodothermales bacterium]